MFEICGDRPGGEWWILEREAYCENGVFGEEGEVRMNGWESKRLGVFFKICFAGR